MQVQQWLGSVRSWHQADWVRLYCRFMTLFAVQGVVVLALYAVRGWNADPDSLPLGLQLDPLHGLIHLITGMLGAYFGFLRPAGALRFLQLFAVFYLSLAILGTFTRIHLGMQLELAENVLHWGLSVPAVLIAFGPAIRSLLAPK